ncbi:MAG TPA: hypothetical protein VLF18_00765 [Tahibacter sp.]|uniref:hypothetical protein n=1 Tax=Tahibacter sp. TaxID=2056211 RepID=UPI002BE23EDE|nr:hypothetical protein [Tahibacter sp.]HSX58705.1 hypothetical protein [Tahibacter sp.]
MITTEETFVGSDTATVLGGSLVIRSKLNKGDRAADLIFEFRDGLILEKNFMDLRFNEASKKLVPILEVLWWGGCAVMIGLRVWLVLAGSPIAQVDRLELHRSASDDSGFYSLRFLEIDSVLIGVYEGGVVAVSNAGKIIWHRQKHWDDELLCVDGDRLVFLAENGRRFALDCGSGKDVVLG